MIISCERFVVLEDESEEVRRTDQLREPVENREVERTHRTKINPSASHANSPKDSFQTAESESLVTFWREEERAL